MFKSDVQEKTIVDINKLVLSVLALVQIDLQKHAIFRGLQRNSLLNETGNFREGTGNLHARTGNLNQLWCGAISG
jgi:hypothetical protein